MESGSIQLPFGFIPDQKTENDLQFNLPLNYKKDLLFDKLPYVTKLENPAMENVLNGNNADDLSVQKFLLATNLLQDSVQESLNMIVTDGNFNNASIRRALDTKYLLAMKKPKRIDFVFKDKAKFDVQNPIIGSLFEQITKNNKKEVVRKLLNASTAQKDTKTELEKIVEFSRKIRKDDDDVDDDYAFNTAASSSTPVADRCRFLPTSSLNDTRKFLLDLNVNENIEATESTSPVRSSNKKIEFPDSVSKMFPNAHKIDADSDEFDDKSDDESISEV